MAFATRQEYINEANNLSVIHGVPPACFLSTALRAPGGNEAAWENELRFHFHTFPCGDAGAIGQQVDCIPVNDPFSVITHLEGECPFRNYLLGKGR